MYWEFAKDAPSSFGSVGNDVYIGDTTIIKRRELFRCGNHVAIDDFGYFTTRVELGSYIHIAPGNYIIGGKDSLFVAEDFAEFAPRSTFVCASDEWRGWGLVSPVIPDKYRDHVVREPIRIGKYAGVASHCVLSPGVVLEEGAVLGANSFVPAHTVIPAWEIWAGTPAKRIGYRDSALMKSYGARLLEERP